MQQQKKIWSVSEINKYMKTLLQNDICLRSVLVKGEISNFVRHSSGHLYFSLKDSSGSIKCVMFRGNAQKLLFSPVHGMQVLVGGYVSVFERDGVYQLYVEQMLETGAGALHMAYEKRKAAFIAEGLFAVGRKRPLPSLPQHIGIVTSPTGAAVRDLVSIIRRRDPAVSIYVVPAIVQGKEGVASICQALEVLYQQSMDVIIVGRGGGSLEELWCFNEEDVVRKIVESPVPIISAVGHETDVTLADFAADVRAATPSMAAELAVPVLEELRQKWMLQIRHLLHVYELYLQKKRMQLNYILQHRIFQRPEFLLQERQQWLDASQQKLMEWVIQSLKQKQQQIAMAAGQLQALSPLQVLSRGYALCEDAEGALIRHAETVTIGQRIQIVLEESRLQATVTKKEEILWGKRN